MPLAPFALPFSPLARLHDPVVHVELRVRVAEGVLHPERMALRIRRRIKHGYGTTSAHWHIDHSVQSKTGSTSIFSLDDVLRLKQGRTVPSRAAEIWKVMFDGTCSVTAGP